MEIKAWTYDEFPECAAVPDGARVLETTGDESGSRYVPDVVYLCRGDRELHLQLLIPTSRNLLNATAAGERPTYPCLVYVQGSAWRKQDCYKNLPQLARIAERGIVVAVVEYRDSSMACFPAQVHDAQAAVRFVAEHADELSVDPDKIVIGGSSSGGHTAVLATLLPDENGSPAADLPVRGVLDFYGAVSFLREDGYPTTLDAGSLTSPEGALAGGSLCENPELRYRISADTYLSSEAPMPPVLIVHGTKDRMVNCEVSTDFYNLLRAQGRKAELVLIKGGDHGGSEFYVPEAIDVYEDFVRRCVMCGARCAARCVACGT